MVNSDFSIIKYLTYIVILNIDILSTLIVLKVLYKNKTSLIYSLKA